MISHSGMWESMGTQLGEPVKVLRSLSSGGNTARRACEGVASVPVGTQLGEPVKVLRNLSSSANNREAGLSSLVHCACDTRNWVLSHTYTQTRIILTHFCSWLETGYGQQFYKY